MRKFAVLILFLSTLFVKAQSESPWVPGIVLVKITDQSNIDLPAFTDSLPYPYFDSLAANFGFYQVRPRYVNPANTWQQHCYEIRFSSDRIDDLITRLQEYAFIEHVSGIGKINFLSKPDDHKYPLQWSMKKILADSIWHLLPGTGGVVQIGIIDDAFLLTHEDFRNTIHANAVELGGTTGVDDDANGKIDDIYGWDFGDNDNNVNPPAAVGTKEWSHGTHCAQLAGARTNNDSGIASFNYTGKFELIPAKCSKDNDWVYNPGLDLMINYLIDQGADVITLSLGVTASVFDRNLIASNPQVIFVAAAGNNNNTDLVYPSAYDLPNMISVAATNEYDERAAFSTFNDSVDVCAPGVGLISGMGTGDDEYAYKNGTSGATPQVAGLCAALLSFDNSLSPAQVIARVLTTADSIYFENPNYSDQLGWGRINCYRAFHGTTTQPHQAGFKINKNPSLCAGDTIRFTARTYSNVWYVWEFGDGVKDSSASPGFDHIYTLTGNFTVTLTIKNNSGAPLAFNAFEQYIGVTACAPVLNDQAQWFFGHYGQLDFRSGRPVSKDSALVNTTVLAAEGSFSTCNSVGELLFYGGNRNPGTSAGSMYIFDKHHDLVKTNTVVAGTPAQGFIVCPLLNRYYVFETSVVESGNGMHCNIIDSTTVPISVADAFPVLPDRMNVPILTSGVDAILSDESITAIPNCDNNGYWIIIHGHKDDANYYDKIIVLEFVDSAGSAKIRFHDSIINLPGKSVEQTNLKVSPDGKFVAIGNQYTGFPAENTSTVFAFNTKTGLLDPLYSFPFGGSGGLSFSSNSRFLYIYDSEGGQMFQVDLYSTDPVSTKVSNRNEAIVYDMLLGPDKKIYVSYGAELDFLGVLDFPDSLCTFDNPNNCGYRLRALNLFPGTRASKLPNMINALIADSIPRNFNAMVRNCTEVAFFAVPACDTVLTWHFGDGETSTLFRPVHTYAKPGTYQVRMKFGSDSIVKEIRTAVVSTIHGDSCLSDSSVFYHFSSYKNDYYKYQWSATNGIFLNDSLTDSVRVRFPRSGTLKLLVIDRRTGCKDSTTIPIHIIPKMEVTYSPEYICNNAGPFYQNIAVKLRNWSGGTTKLYYWVKSAAGSTYILKDSFPHIHDNTYEVRVNSFDTVKFSINVPCGSIYSVLIPIDSLVRNTIQPSQNQMQAAPLFPCFIGSAFTLIGTNMIGVDTPSRYQWQKSLDSLNWQNTSAGDTFMHYTSTLTDTLIWYRRIALFTHCWDSSAPIRLEPSVYVRSTTGNFFVCPAYGANDAPFKLDLRLGQGAVAYVELFKRGANQSSFSLVSGANYVAPFSLLSDADDGDSFYFKITVLWINPNCGTVYTSKIRVSNCTNYNAFLTHPQNTSIDVDASGQLSVTMNTPCAIVGAPIPGERYWEFSRDNGILWHKIPNSSSTTLNLQNVSICDNGYRYRFVDLWECNSLIASNSAILTVNKVKNPDVWMRDYTDDNGNEPNVTTVWPNYYNPPDFWITHIPGDQVHRGVYWFPATHATSNYVHYRIKNRSTQDTSKPAELYMFWTFAQTGERWPTAWIDAPGNRFLNMDASNQDLYMNEYPMGDSINNVPIYIPAILPLHEHRDSFKWENVDVPNPSRYYSTQGPSLIYKNEADICLLARIETCHEDSFGLFRKETEHALVNMKNNNNIVGRNTKLINLTGQLFKHEVELSVREFQNDQATVRVKLVQAVASPYSVYGEVRVFLNNELWNAWVAGGYQGTGYTVVQNNELLVTNLSNFELAGINLLPDSFGNMRVVFTLLNVPSFNISTKFYVSQHVGSAPPPIGGFIIDVNVTGSNVIVLRETRADSTEKEGGVPDVPSVQPFLADEETADKPTPNQAQPNTVIAYPNPFSGEVTFAFTLVSNGTVGFELFNTLGIPVGSIRRKEYTDGSYTVVFDGSHLPPAAYYCKAEINGEITLIRLILNR